MKKSITKNYIYNLAYQILLIITPLITTPYLSKVLGTEGVGIYSYTLSIATYFVLFGSLGVAMYGQREVAYLQEDKKKRTSTFWEIVIFRCITMTISLVIFYFIFANGPEYQLYYKILILELIANMIDISWFFQGMEEFKKTVTRNLFVKLVSVICIFVFIKAKEDLYKYILIYVLSNLLGNLSLWLYLPRYVQKIKFKQLHILKHLKPTIALFIPQIAMQVYTILDKTMLGSILGDMNQVGIYEQSQKIVKMPLTILTALGTVVAPRIANIASKDKKEEIQGYIQNSFSFVWLVGIPMMFGIMAIADDLIPWFLGTKFNGAIQVLYIGAPIIMAVGLNNVTGIQYLIPAKKENIFTRSVVIGAIFNFITNLILIPILKSKGAILASLLAETLILIIQLYYIRDEIDIKLAYKNSFKYILSGILMFIVTFAVGRFLDSTIKTTIIQILLGGCVYFITLIILKDELVYEFLNKLKAKIR